MLSASDLFILDPPVVSDPNPFVTGVVPLASTKYTGDARHIHYVSWPGAVPHARHEPLFHPESSLQLADHLLENTTKSCQSPILEAMLAQYLTQHKLATLQESQLCEY